jgi:hypothetical protein
MNFWSQKSNVPQTKGIATPARARRARGEPWRRARALEAFTNDVFYQIGYDLRATIVGLNLPFNISRLAIAHASARAPMRHRAFALLSARKAVRG